MDIPEATDAMPHRAVLARSKYSFRTLAHKVPTRAVNEPLISLSDKALRLQPFWEASNDLEGLAYTAHLQTHPDFTLQLRVSVAKRLEAAQALLPEGFTIVVKAGYRPLEVQERLLRMLQKDIRAREPRWDEATILRHARTFVTDPRVMTPPHCTGAAVDIDLVDNHGEPVDMGCPPNTDSELAYTHSTKLLPHQKRNRKVVLTALLAVGFANLAFEWWHFSYGDAYWAAFYGKPAALYDVIND